MTEILVIGGGPAGLAAAEAASSHGKQVTIIDENPAFGGQIWRAEKSVISEEAKGLINSLEKNCVEMLPSCACIASLPEKRILALSNGHTFTIAYDKVIIATGARERFIPFPGWTLPGVFGAGGLQALVKGGYDISGKRIVVAGTGPLLLAVTAYLKKKGGNVLMIAERLGFSSLAMLGLAAALIPSKLIEGLKLRATTAAIPLRTGSVVTEASGKTSIESITLLRRGQESRVACDLLAIGHHIFPNIEVAGLMRCEFKWPSAVLVDDLQKTSVDDVFCAGEPTGIGGVEKSLIEGRIAGLASADRIREATSLGPRRRRLVRFAERISDLFPVLYPDLAKLPSEDTIICRCEDVPYARIKGFDGFTETKLQTRIGMGSCQGRVCGASFIAGDGTASIRPPLVPVRISELANYETEKD